MIDDNKTARSLQLVHQKPYRSIRRPGGAHAAILVEQRRRPFEGRAQEALAGDAAPNVDPTQSNVV
jgi:hypothetical protein